MVWNIFANLRPTKDHLSFLLTLKALMIMFLLAWFKSVDIMTTLPVVLGIYIGARTAEKSVSVYAAAKDPQADTRQVINDLESK